MRLIISYQDGTKIKVNCLSYTVENGMLLYLINDKGIEEIKLSDTHMVFNVTNGRAIYYEGKEFSEHEIKTETQKFIDRLKSIKINKN